MSLFSHVVVRFVNVSWGGMLLWVLLFCVFWCSLDRFCFFLKVKFELGDSGALGLRWSGVVAAWVGGLG